MYSSGPCKILQLNPLSTRGYLVEGALHPFGSCREGKKSILHGQVSHYLLGCHPRVPTKPPDIKHTGEIHRLHWLIFAEDLSCSVQIHIDSSSPWHNSMLVWCPRAKCATHLPKTPQTTMVPSHAHQRMVRTNIREQKWSDSLWWSIIL